MHHPPVPPHLSRQAFEENPGKGMMVEYPHLPDGIVTTVLPEHYGVTVSEAERERMMSTTQMYSKVRTRRAADILGLLGDRCRCQAPVDVMFGCQRCKVVLCLVMMVFVFCCFSRSGGDVL